MYFLDINTYTLKECMYVGMYVCVRNVLCSACGATPRWNVGDCLGALPEMSSACEAKAIEVKAAGTFCTNVDVQ